MLFHFLGFFFFFFFIEIKPRQPIRVGVLRLKQSSRNSEVPSQATGENVIFSMSSPGRGAKLPILMCSYIFSFTDDQLPPLELTPTIYTHFTSLHRTREGLLSEVYLPRPSTEWVVMGWLMQRAPTEVILQRRPTAREKCQSAAAGIRLSVHTETEIYLI